VKCSPDDIVTLYYTGHADEVNETHRVWTGDTIDPVSGTLETKLLAELMLVGTPLRYALIILDTCFAGKGGAEALRASMPSIGAGGGKTLALLTAAYPREQIVAGDFARLFEHAVEQPAVAGHEPPYLALGAIARLIERTDPVPAGRPSRTACWEQGLTSCRSCPTGGSTFSCTASTCSPSSGLNSRSCVWTTCGCTSCRAHVG